MNDFTREVVDAWHGSMGFLGFMLGLLAPVAIVIVMVLVLVVGVGLLTERSHD